MDEFEKEMKASFLDEVSQLLADAEQCFLELEDNPTDKTILEKIFRIAHNIKGSSKAVGFNELGAFTHEFETFMLLCKSGEIPIGTSTISLLLKCNDHIKEWISVLNDDLNSVLDSNNLINEIQNFSFKEESVPELNNEEIELFQQENEGEILDSNSNDESISIDEIKLLESKVLNPKPIIKENEHQVKLVTVEAPTNKIEISESNKEKLSVASSKIATDESIRVSLTRLEGLLNFVGELVILQTVLKEQVQIGNQLVLKRTVDLMGKVTKEVQEISMSLRMVPLKQTFQKMQRIVRDTSSQLSKRVQLILDGEDTEVDKTVLESLGDPLVHIIRNAVDHGIESTEERKNRGKPEIGRILLRSYHQGGKLIIEIKDDGAGISAERLKEKAIEKGIIKSGQQLSETESINLIFHSGFSTKSQVTDVSGRGVGMDVVKTNIEQIQGEVIVESELHVGTTFKIILPLTLAIIDGMIIRCQNERYVIPLSHVHETLKPDPKDLKYVTGLGEVLNLRNENLPLIRLDQILNQGKKNKVTSDQIAIIVRVHGQPFAALVDEVIGQHQVVIKKLGSEMQNLSGYSGSSILGDGKPALILELSELVHSYRQINSNNIKRQVSI